MMRVPASLRRLAVPVLLLGAAACNSGTEPDLGGEYLGMVDSPFSVEGAALIEITHPDIRAIRAPGRTLVARGVTERTVRLLLVNPPRALNGGPLTFVVRMADGAAPPTGVVLQAAGPGNLPRDFVGEYAVRFTRLEGGAGPVTGGPPPAGPAPTVSWSRLVAPFFPGGPALEPEEELYVDRAGNANRVFDLGDVRGYMGSYPSVTPPETVWSR